jgi:RNA polymerase sigma factor (sigma-70 family)
MKLFRKTWTDAALVQEIQAGGRAENAAIAALYDMHRSTLQRFVGHKASQEFAKQPEDIVWEAIEAFVHNVKTQKYQPQAGVPVEAYLKSICKNLWHKYLTQEEARGARQEVFVDWGETTDLDVSEVLMEQEKWNSYLALFEQAGKNCRDILTMSFADEMPVNEVAKILMAEGRYENEQTVRNAKSRCLKRMMDMMSAIK